jgi:pyruvate,water dikinase
MSRVEVAAVPLAEARDEAELGGKAVQLGAAVRAGLPVPAGAVLGASRVEEIAGGAASEDILAPLVEEHGPALAVRSSGIGEDGLQASFAGQHLSCLNVCSAEALAQAIAEVHLSATAEPALAYRRRMGLDSGARTGVVVQRLVPSDVAGVLFTTNPITGADERMIEASWGLGEAVVGGRVIPDRFRIARSGEVLERAAGVKELAIVPARRGGTRDRGLEADRAAELCLDDAMLAQLHELAGRCEDAFGPARDIEWAFAEGALHLLQCRAATR